METQTIVNVLLSVCGVVVGFLVKSLWDRVDSLVSADTKLTEKVNAIEVLVAGTYVKKDELERYMAAIFAKLDRMMEKLEHKQDRSGCRSREDD